MAPLTLETINPKTMRLLLYVCLFATLCLASCAKENTIVQPDQRMVLDQDLVYLNVSVMAESSVAENGGCMGNERCTTGIDQATVTVYAFAEEKTAVVAEARTDRNGVVSFSELEHQTLRIDVACELGEQTITVEPNKGQFTNVIVRY